MNTQYFANSVALQDTVHMKRAFNLLGEHFLVQTLRGYSARAIRTAEEGTACCQTRNS